MHWIALQSSASATEPAEPASTHASTAAAASAEAQASVGWALQFTPRVALAGRADMPQAVLLEISASERLFGGRRALLQRLLEQAPLPLQWARGATALLALGRLYQHSRHGAPRHTPADQLSLPALAATLPHLATLTQLGCRCWADLRQLPRGGVARRFGQGLLDALDRAYGQQPESYPWISLSEQFDQSLELQAQVENASALLFGARRLLGHLHLWLQARQRGLLALRLGWLMDARRDTEPEGELLLRTAEPTLDMLHVQHLLAEQLAQITLSAPVHTLRLRSHETAALPPGSASLLLQDLRAGDALHQLLERLAQRLGPAQVQCVQPLADHRPEAMQHWVPAQGRLTPLGHAARQLQATGPMGSQLPGSDALYPAWLLAQPQPLSVQRNRPHYLGPLTLLAGPQRLETGGWITPASATPSPAAATLRDYFIARSPQAGLLWIYRERLPRSEQVPGWFLHGLFA